MTKTSDYGRRYAVIKRKRTSNKEADLAWVDRMQHLGDQMATSNWFSESAESEFWIYIPDGGKSSLFEILVSGLPEEDKRSLEFYSI